MFEEEIIMKIYNNKGHLQSYIRKRIKCNTIKYTYIPIICLYQMLYCRKTSLYNIIDYFKFEQHFRNYHHNIIIV